MASSANGEWQTPTEILDVVEEVLDIIDLDPASPGKGNTLVMAERYFTIEDDGLAQPWNARTVFLNPPYGREIGRWTRKLSEEYKEGRTKEFVALLPARVDTRWWQVLITGDMLVCFVNHRLRFLNAAMQPEDPAMFPSALVYGPPWSATNITALEHFSTCCKGLGQIWKRV